jgi:hypothetical protein
MSTAYHGDRMPANSEQLNSTFLESLILSKF